jgi:hypothetical protein
MNPDQVNTRDDADIDVMDEQQIKALEDEAERLALEITTRSKEC